MSYAALGLSPVFGNIVAFLEAYFDESLGRDGNQTVVVSGFVSDIDTWATFASEWQSAVLDRFQIPYFRMKDFGNRQSRLFRHLTKADRDLLLSTVVELAAKSARFAVSCTVDEGVYNEATSPEFRSRYGTAFTRVFSSCIGVIGHFLPVHFPDCLPHLSVFLEDGHVNVNQSVHVLQQLKRSQELRQLFNEDILAIADSGHDEGVIITGSQDPDPFTIDTVGIGSKKSKAPLQIADVLAHSVLCESTTNRQQPLAKAIVAYFENNIPVYQLELSPRGN